MVGEIDEEAIAPFLAAEVVAGEGEVEVVGSEAIAEGGGEGEEVGSGWPGEGLRSEEGDQTGGLVSIQCPVFSVQWRVLAAAVKIGEEAAEVLVAGAVLDEEGDLNAEFGRRNAEFGRRNAEFGRRNAEFGRRNAEFGRRNAEFGRRKVEAGGREFGGGADEGTEAGLAGGEVGAGGSVDAHVIGEGDGLVAEFGGAADEVLGMAGPAEEGEGGAGVEFGEGHEVRVKVRVKRGYWLLGNVNVNVNGGVDWAGGCRRLPCRSLARRQVPTAWSGEGARASDEAITAP